MKKLTLSILALLALTATGCTEYKSPEQRQQAFEEDVASHINEFNYKGHQYIMYRETSGYNGYCAMVHDPNCPCHKQQTTEIE